MKSDVFHQDINVLVDKAGKAGVMPPFDKTMSFMRTHGLAAWSRDPATLHRQRTGHSASHAGGRYYCIDCDWPKRFKIYFDLHDWWIGYYFSDTHHYVCPLPTLVLRWTRQGRGNRGWIR